MRLIDAISARDSFEDNLAYMGSEVKRILNIAPTVDAVPVVHGRWVFDFSLDNTNFYRCSICGRQETLLAKESTAEYYPYCHCGAKMDGDGNG